MTPSPAVVRMGHQGEKGARQTDGGPVPANCSPQKVAGHKPAGFRRSPTPCDQGPKPRPAVMLLRPDRPQRTRSGQHSSLGRMPAALAKRWPPAVV
jgi:hypothetical protein